jgi:outer membrane protein assembly factor BamB
MPSTRRTFLASLASAGLVAAAGCSVNSDRPAYRSYGYGPHNRNATTVSGPTDDVSVSWRIEDGARFQVPAVVDDRVFIATQRRDGSVVAAVDAGSGEQDWEYDAGSPIGGWRPAVVDGTLYFIDRSGRAHAIGPDGSARWSHTVEPVTVQPSAPAVADGTVYYGGADGRLYALDAADGSRLWQFGAEMAGFRTPVVVDGTIYAASSGGLVALTAA